MKLSDIFFPQPDYKARSPRSDTNMFGGQDIHWLTLGAWFLAITFWYIAIPLAIIWAFQNKAKEEKENARIDALPKRTWEVTPVYSPQATMLGKVIQRATKQQELQANSARIRAKYFS